MGRSIRSCPVGVLLVLKNTDITLVIRIGPHSVGGPQVAWPTQIAHHPETGPVPCRRRFRRKDDFGFHIASLDTKLIPRLKHTRTEICIVFHNVFHSNDQRPVHRADCFWRVPFVILGGKIVKVACLPKRIFPWPECAPILVELVTKNKIPFTLIILACPGMGIGWRIRIN